MIRIILATSRLDVQDSILNAINSDDQVEIIGIARNGIEAVNMTRSLRPDLVVMGTHLQTLDGVEATREIMIQAPTPIVLVFSTPYQRAPEISALALEAGALAVIPAPLQKGASPEHVFAGKFLSTVKAMSQVKVVRRWRGSPRTKSASDETTAVRRGPLRIVGIASSTGGPAAVQSILAKLPGDFPAPILVVQHITTGFIDGVASWLDAATPLRVKVAQNGDSLEPHVVYLAPDSHHLGVASRSRIMVTDAAPINGFRPSGTYLFASMAHVFGAEALGVILTGMGDDGAEGLRALHRAGGTVLAQNEATSVVFGMPKAAIESGVAHRVLPLDDIPRSMVSAVKTGRWDI